MRVFRGATDVLDTPDAPIVLFEMNSQAARTAGAAISEPMVFLQDLRLPCFNFYQVEDKQLIPYRGHDGTFNVLAVPKNRLAEVKSKF
jgi:hypothetical protein